MKARGFFAAKAVADREELDEVALACYYRCREGGLTHYQAMIHGRDDMAIRIALAKRLAQTARVA